MSWQRIDENIYIDDTLVTCAEYQLFIDEMREQGKYYQPDHWTSYQFPEGQAREPVLGVRHSDAMMFCEWLTKRETEWQYRLPIKGEIINKQVNCLQSHVSIGNWVLMSNGSFPLDLFIWIKPVFIHPDKLPLDPGVYLDRIRHNVVDLDSSFLRNEMQKILAEPELAQILSVSRVLDIEREIDRTFNDRLPTNYFRHTRLGENGPKQVKEFDEIFKIAFSRNMQQRRNLDECLVRVINLTHELDNAFENIFRHVLRFDGRRAFSRDYNFDLAIQFVRTVDLYINVLTLQERIAGRSPAFEGIRLVKERIR